MYTFIILDATSINPFNNVEKITLVLTDHHHFVM